MNNQVYTNDRYIIYIHPFLPLPLSLHAFRRITSDVTLPRTATLVSILYVTSQLLKCTNVTLYALVYLFLASPRDDGAVHTVVYAMWCLTLIVMLLRYFYLSHRWLHPLTRFASYPRVSCSRVVCCGEVLVAL